MHIPMFTPMAATLFLIATGLAVALHWYNQMRPERLASFSKAGLIDMFRQMERNMVYDCGVMVFMSFHALGWLHGGVASLAGWLIVGTRIYIAYRALRRSVGVYGLNDDLI